MAYQSAAPSAAAFKPLAAPVAAAPLASVAPAAPASLRDFEIIQPLGKGSYGSVHKARRKADGFE